MAPVAALISWFIAHRRGSGGAHAALVGAVGAVFLLLPWGLMVMEQVGMRMSKPVVVVVGALLHLTWLLCPILAWVQFRANFGFLSIMDTFPPPLLGYGVFTMMAIAWVYSILSYQATEWGASHRWPQVPGVVRTRLGVCHCG